MEHKFSDEQPSMKTYRKGCRCEACKAANAKAQRDYQAKLKAKATEAVHE